MGSCNPSGANKLQFILHDVCLDHVINHDVRRRIEAVELDVACTRDGSLVVLPCAAALEKESAFVVATTNEIHALDPKMFPPIGVVLDKLSELGFSVILDLKARLNEERLFASAIQEASRPSLLFVSYNHRLVRLLAEFRGEESCGIIFAGLPVDIPQLSRRAGASWVVMQSRFLSESLCQNLRESNMHAMTFSARTTERLQEAISSGADAIMVDYEIAKSLPFRGDLIESENSE
ncbi:hypothetical protein [Streptomyces sp. NRRL S-1824]|uniref:hypothetical protein n=1 Tax=Streptomyces sp. NRRL S-1824 TaxID=1463889 RepID=UPI00131DC05C|nr:hypothetical protein [Streptomyces sp. NRRL S-1824]